jgi:predicted metal-dependent phosphoesterase TrpH
MADALAGMGAPISLDRIREIAGKGAICRPHLARALVEAGHVNSYQEAFDRFIGRGSPAYVERTKLSPEGACLLIRAAGGIPVLAHPVFFDRYGAIRSSVELDGLLPRLVASGLGGLEVYYPGYDAVTIERLLHLARRYELAPTGGTDFHGARFGDADIGGCYVPAKVVRGLRAAWERQR